MNVRNELGTITDQELLDPPPIGNSISKNIVDGAEQFHSTIFKWLDEAYNDISQITQSVIVRSSVIERYHKGCGKKKALRGLVNSPMHNVWLVCLHGKKQVVLS